MSLVAVLDADKEGFLRSSTSLIQTAGRAARHVEGKVIFYADTVTRSMQAAMDEMNRRREIQLRYNEEHGVTPASIVKGIGEALSRAEPELPLVAEEEEDYGGNLLELVASLEKQMYAAARELEFEKAAALRDRIKKLRDLDLRASA